jgi:hypothetical protein
MGVEKGWNRDFGDGWEEGLTAQNRKNWLLPIYLNALD